MKESVLVGSCEVSSCNNTTVLSKEEFEWLGKIAFLDGICKDNPYELVERYITLQSLKQYSNDLSFLSGGHLCDGTRNIEGKFAITCKNRTVHSLSLLADWYEDIGLQNTFFETLKNFKNLGTLK